MVPRVEVPSVGPERTSRGHGLRGGSSRGYGPAVAKESYPADWDRKYTDPQLRLRLKDEVVADDKGGKPGQWSARKAQLLKHEYEQAGGGYLGEKDETQQHLSEWSAEDWQTSDGSARGEQFVANPDAAAEAGREARRHDAEDGSD